MKEGNAMDIKRIDHKDRSEAKPQREVAQAQDAMLKGNMGGCAMHLSRAMSAGSMAQSSPAYPS